MGELAVSIFGFVVLGVFIYCTTKFISSALDKEKAKRDAKRLPEQPVHCMTCGEEGLPSEGARRGSTTIEVVLWVLFFTWPIALVYSVWRRIGKGAKAACPSCGADTLVPASSLAARAHARQLAAAIGPREA